MRTLRSTLPLVPSRNTRRGSACVHSWFRPMFAGVIDYYSSVEVPQRNDILATVRTNQTIRTNLLWHF